jgi:hypothetical protein
MSHSPDIYSNYYIQTSHGGWSPCIQGNDDHGLRPFSGSVLPNCVGMICGEFNERLNLGACTYFGSTDARNLYALGASQGLATGTDPVVGAVIVWDDGNHGHAAIVDEIVSSTEIVTHESGWNYDTAPCWHVRNRYKVGGVWEYKTGYTFTGFVYPPGTNTGDETLLAYMAFRLIICR